MGQILHRSATTTEAIRRAIQNSEESLRALPVMIPTSGTSTCPGIGYVSLACPCARSKRGHIRWSAGPLGQANIASRTTQ